MVMQRIVALIGAGLALIGSVVLAYHSKAAAPRDVQIIPASCNFGRVSQRAELRRQIEIVNVSKSPVDIVRVVTTCDCAESSLSSSRLLPGERATLDVLWRTGARRGPSRATITIVSASGARDSGFQMASVDLIADVEATFDLSADELSFDRDRGGQEEWVAFRPLGSHAVKLVNVYSTHLAISVEVSEKSDGFWVRFDPDQWPDDREGAEVVVETTSTSEPRRTLPVFTK